MITSGRTANRIAPNTAVNHGPRSGLCHTPSNRHIQVIG